MGRLVEENQIVKQAGRRCYMLDKEPYYMAVQSLKPGKREREGGGGREGRGARGRDGREREGEGRGEMRSYICVRKI
jgi:hypothetical protein